ncbi:hypothetical protein Tco_0743784 [Tanacetum coccineum]
MQKQFDVWVSKMKAFRAKRIATDKMTRSFMEQYSLLREYSQELINQNPGITVWINVQQEPNPESLTRTFRRVSLVRSNLTIVRVDINNRIYPVAYAIGEAESKASWCWFLNLHGEDLGLIQAIASMFLTAEHMYCVRHIHENTKSQFKGGRAKCDLFFNNIYEVFNRQLVDGRDPPIITCLEYIREYLMKRIVVVQKVIAKTVRTLTPSVTSLFDAIKKVTEYIVQWNGGVGISKQWVHAAYRLETWAHVYSFKVNPCNGREMWLVVEFTTVIIPHLYKPKVGRPLKKRKKSHDEIASESCSSGKLSRKGNQAGGSSQASAKNVSGQAVVVKNASSQSGGSSQPSAAQSTTTGVRNASSQAAGASQPSAAPSIASQRPTQHRNTTGINVTEKIDKVEQEREKQDKEDNKKTSVEVTDNNRGEKNFMDVANAARLNNSLITIPTMLKDDGNDVVIFDDELIEKASVK